MGNKIDREQLKSGDHIYSWRKAYIYAHHGIYVGDGMVIHFTRAVGQEVGTGTIFQDRLLVSSVPPHDTNIPCPRCGYQSKKEGVISSCLDCFLYDGNLYLFEYGVSLAFFLAQARGGTCTRLPSDPTEDVLHRASILHEHGFGAYDIYENNCENFAIYCKTGMLVRSEQAASFSAAVNAIVSTAYRKMSSPSHVSGLAMVGLGMYSYCIKRLPSNIERRQDASKIPVESLIASLGLNEPEKTAEVPVERPIASPNLNEQEKTDEVPAEMLIASPGLNEPQKTAEVPVESHKASPGLNEPEKTAEVPAERPIASPNLNEQEKTAKENQHWLNRGSGNRGGGRRRRGRRPSVTCKVCLKSGHSADNCYYRFDSNYLPRQSPQPVFPPGLGPHTAHLAAMPTTPQVLNGKSRFPDSAATNHATVDRENLAQSSEYNGSERLSAAPAAAAGPAAPPPETDRWTNRSSKPDGNRWRNDDRRPAFGSGGGSRSSSTRSSSRNQRDR